MEALAAEAENSGQNNTEAWCEVVSKRKKGGKSAPKDCGAKAGHCGGECLDEETTAEKHIAKILTSPDETSNRAAAEVSETPERWSQIAVNEEEEWIDVAPRRQKNDSLAKHTGEVQKELKPLPPWRQRQPAQRTPTAAEFGPDGCEDRFKVLRSDPLPETAREKRHGKQIAPETKAVAKSNRFCIPESQNEPSQDMYDRFKVLRPEKSLEQAPASRQGKHSFAAKKANSDKSKAAGSERAEQPTAPDVEEKDDIKRKAKEEILNELEACLGGTPLKRADFDMPCWQYLHAIYEKGGRSKVRDAIDVVKASTMSKSRDCVRNWPGYVLKILRNFFNDLRDSQAGATKERAHVAENLHGAQYPKVAPESPQLAPNSPSFGPKLSGSLSDISPSLRPGG